MSADSFSPSQFQLLTSPIPSLDMSMIGDCGHNFYYFIIIIFLLIIIYYGIHQYILYSKKMVGFKLGHLSQFWQFFLNLVNCMRLITAPGKSCK